MRARQPAAAPGRLKVLPAVFSSDGERLWRFEREARVLASLNHPNIAQVHGLEESGTSRALVMELVDGETLLDRIAGGPLSIDEASAIARQIAEALEAAHDAGIIHRDLKPANIKLRGDGTVKVLDFGLAKGLDAVSQAETGGATRSGVVLGTLAYMSPEQARGKTVDKRADIWAFGCVFYEMLTGQRLFGGESASDTLAALLTADIDLARLPAAVPAGVRRILERCLDRDPKTRLRDIGEVRVALSTAEPASRSDPATASPRRAVTVAGTIALLALGAVAGAAIARWYRSGETVHAPAYRFQVPTPPMLDLTDFELSPDGRTLAFVALSDSRLPMVWVRPLDAGAAIVLDGTEGASGVFWSADSQSVGYAVNHQLRRRGLQRGPSQVIGSFTGQFVGAAWSDDTIVFGAYPAGLMRIPASGGEPAALTNLRDGDRMHARPLFLADGRRLLVQALGDARAQTCTVSLDDPALRCTDADASLIAYLPSGHALSLRDGSLLTAAST